MNRLKFSIEGDMNGCQTDAEFQNGITASVSIVTCLRAQRTSFTADCEDFTIKVHCRGAVDSQNLGEIILRVIHTKSGRAAGAIRLRYKLEDGREVTNFWHQETRRPLSPLHILAEIEEAMRTPVPV